MAAEISKPVVANQVCSRRRKGLDALRSHVAGKRSLGMGRRMPVSCRCHWFDSASCRCARPKGERDRIG